MGKSPVKGFPGCSLVMARGGLVKNRRGFSLLELLIVVAIILIIATIAIPSLLRSRQSANETAAVATLKMVNTAEVTYSSAAGSTYGSLPELIAAGLMDTTVRSFVVDSTAGPSLTSARFVERGLSVCSRFQTDSNQGGQLMNKNNRGFSLLELLIVVAIILIIATIAIPSLLRSRQAANESAAVAQVRTITTAEVTYLSSSGGSYGDVSQLVSAGLLDSGFNGTKGGYNYSVTTSGTDYTVFASPASTNNGRYGYYSTPDGVVRYSTVTTLAPTSRSGNPVQ